MIDTLETRELVALSMEGAVGQQNQLMSTNLPHVQTRIGFTRWIGESHHELI